MRPRLLVSVRSPEEALAALEGGCDLLDVKEPSRGPLGAADPKLVAAICEVAERWERSVPVSAALGELNEWTEAGSVDGFRPGVSLAKLGLSGCRRQPGWPQRWRRLRERFDAAAGRPLGWIAVLYADAAAEGPDPLALIDLASTTDCRGVLVDTFSKDGRRLFDHASPERVAEWRRAAEAAGLMFAVAGSLRTEDLPRLKTVRPDVIAVRGAACPRGRRGGDVCAAAVRRFQAAIDIAFHPEPR